MHTEYRHTTVQTTGSQINLIKTRFNHATLKMNYYMFCNCAAEGKRLAVTGVHIYLHCLGLLRMLEMDNTEEKRILGAVK